MCLRFAFLLLTLLWLPIFSAVPTPAAPAPDRQHPQRSIPATTDSADARLASGTALFERGRFEDALKEWQEAAQLFAAAHDQPGLSRALLRQGTAYLVLGKYPKAIRALERSREAAEEAGEMYVSLAAVASLGNAYSLAGQGGHARRLLQAAVDAGGKAGNSAVVGVVPKKRRKLRRLHKPWMLLIVR